MKTEKFAIENSALFKCWVFFIICRVWIYSQMETCHDHTYLSSICNGHGYNSNTWTAMESAVIPTSFQAQQQLGAEGL